MHILHIRHILYIGHIYIYLHMLYILHIYVGLEVQALLASYTKCVWILVLFHDPSGYWLDPTEDSSEINPQKQQ